ncbi:MAG: bifunctional fructose-bisphosphatase/inositol-phosphate phosphatase [Methanolinea sp.]|nr:bifunctional fructose-bisphosphatase/inositol-phosphate phosphatase [Methanolinea sp.]
MEFLEACTQIAREVRFAIRDLVGTDRGGDTVCMGADGTPTKEIDRVAEECVLSFLRDHALCRTVISEEAGRVDCDGEEGTIFLDPIDGTFNAVVGIPFFALSLAYAEKGEVIHGFVQDLSSGETFLATRGRGSFLDGKPISVSRVSRLDESAMSIYGRKFDPRRVMHVGQKVRRWRLLGASALELSYIGCGRIDGFIDIRGTLRVTDAAAGMLICTEAGGMVSDLEGRPLHFPDEVTIGRCMVATNGVLHHKVIEYLR